MTIDSDEIDNFLELAEFFDGKIRRYSGRGMNGRECLGFTSDCDEVEFIYDCGVRGVPLPKVDSMGLGKVFYWPRITWEEWIDARNEYEESQG